MQQTIKKQNFLEIDACKTIAILGVVIIHTCIAGYSYDVGSANWLSSVFWGSLSRASVPLFFMCSGALLLNPQKELPMKKLLFKNLLRICVALFAWAFAYKLYHLYLESAFSFASVIQAMKEVILFSHESHLYYLHILILVYLFLPVTRVFVAAATKAQLQYALGLWFLFGILFPTVSGFWPFTLLQGIPLQWKMNMTYAAIGYGLLGYYLKRYPIQSRKISLASAAVGFFIIFFGTWIFSLKQGELYLGFLEGMTVGVCLLAIGIFTACFQKKTPWKNKTAKVFTFFSKASFCIFLVHVFFISRFSYWGFTVFLLPCIVSIPMVVLGNLLLSTLVYLVLSRVPVMKRWLV